MKKKIITAASELFLTHGIRGVTMDMLASRLGMSKRTIYEFFPNKDELIRSSVRHFILKENEIMRNIVKDTSDVIEAMWLIGKRKEEGMKEIPPHILNDLKHYITEVMNELYALPGEATNHSVACLLIERGIQEGIFRENLRIELVDAFLQHTILFIHRSPDNQLINYSPEEISNSIILPYYRGLCTQKGIELFDKKFNHPQAETKTT